MATTILTRGQQRLHAFVFALSVYLLANAGYLWLSPPDGSRLPAFYQWMLVSHVVLGIFLLLPMTIFVFWHLRRALAMRNPRGVTTGTVVTVAAFGLFVTGLFLFRNANSEDNRWAFRTHQVLALAAPAAYYLHRVLAHHRPTGRRMLLGAASPFVLLGGMLAIHHATLPEPRPEPQRFVPKPPEGVDPWKDAFPAYGVSGAPADSVFFPAATRTVTGGFLPKGLLTNADTATSSLLEKEIEQHGFAVEARIGSETCARCHQDIVEQWARSAHRYASFNNPFYRASVEAIRAEDDGKKRSQWCAGCHDPAIMMAGNMTQEIVPTIPESQAGLTCLACHLMDEVHGVGGNGNYRIADAAPEPYLFPQAKSGPLAEVHDLLVKSKPDVHRRDMLKPVFRTSEYCGTCHKVSLDTPVNRYRWLRGQNEYDHHQDSGVTHNNARTFYLPPVTKTCQDCHMPLADAPLGDVSAKGGKVRSHLFLGPNTALPHVRGDVETVREMERFLQDAKLRVDVFAVKQGGRVVEAPDARAVALVAGEPVEVQVVVRNLGVGHTFPGGTLDSNESWIELTVADAADPSNALLRSGGMEPGTRYVDRDAHFYRVVFVDEHSREADRRNPQDFRAVVHAKVIGPSTSDVARYSFVPPAEWAGRRLTVAATLKWRKFRQNYVEFAWKATMPGRPVPDLPITDIASGSAQFDVVAPGTPAAGAPAADVPKERLAKEWMRWNDWGIGLLLQGDTAGAIEAFTRLRDAVPEKADPWRNTARAKLVDGDARGAYELLIQADARDPGSPQTAFFLGQALEQLGQLDAAVEQYLKSGERFRDDRTIHLSVGRIRYRQGRLDEALAAFLRALAIDPEDRTAHYHRMLIYRAKADDAPEAERADLAHAAEQAKRAFDKYEIDESAQRWTNEFRRNRPEINLESQLVHVHPLKAVR